MLAQLPVLEHLASQPEPSPANRLPDPSCRRGPTSRNEFALPARLPQFPALPRRAPALRPVPPRPSPVSPSIAVPFVPDNDLRLRAPKAVPAADSPHVPVCRRSVPVDLAPCIRSRDPA
jgi:hypothetical protein